MPRDFDSDAVARSGDRLSFTELTDCQSCEFTFEVSFSDDSDSVQDMTDAPESVVACPSCGFRQLVRMTGWMFFSEAG